jgi:hypothetical protein
VIILDENIIASQCDRLREWRIPFRQVGSDIGRKGMDDVEEILPLLHQQSSATFFTRNPGFYERARCHPSYCLVILNVRKDEAARYIRRFLRHPDFNTRAKRMGRVAKVSPAVVTCWSRDTEEELSTAWPPGRRS